MGPGGFARRKAWHLSLSPKPNPAQEPYQRKREGRTEKDPQTGSETHMSFKGL